MFENITTKEFILSARKGSVDKATIAREGYTVSYDKPSNMLEVAHTSNHSLNTTNVKNALKQVANFLHCLINDKPFQNKHLAKYVLRTGELVECMDICHNEELKDTLLMATLMRMVEYPREKDVLFLLRRDVLERVEKLLTLPSTPHSTLANTYGELPQELMTALPKPLKLLIMKG